MRVFVIGTGGYIGGAAARALRARGADVVGLARNAAAAAALEASGFDAAPGDLDTIGSVLKAVGRVDAVIYAAPALLNEASVIATIIDALEGSDTALVSTSGTGILSSSDAGEPSDVVYAEDDVFTPHRYVIERASAETAVLQSGDRCVRGIVVRPPIVYGNAGSSVIPAAIALAKATGKAIYVGPGLNRWGHVHVDDLGELYASACERGTTGQTCHAVAGEVTWREVAEAIATLVGVPAASVDQSEADEAYGKMRARLVIGGNSRTSSKATETQLDWHPHHHDMIADIVEGSYRALR
jgi:nucleoside-diphosphate-sugar epimerase